MGFSLPGDTHIIYVIFDFSSYQSLSFLGLIVLDVLDVLESGLGVYIGFSSANKHLFSRFPPSLYPDPLWIMIRPLPIVFYEGVDKVNVRATERRARLDKQINDIFVVLSSGLGGQICTASTKKSTDAIRKDNTPDIMQYGQAYLAGGLAHLRGAGARPSVYFH